MRIGVDVRPIGRRQTGNERVMSNLARSLARQSNHELILYFSDRDAANRWREGPVDGTKVRIVPVGNPFIRIPILLPYMAARDGVDVLLCHVNSPPWRRCGLVTIIHDVSFARHPEYFSRYERFLMSRANPASMRWSDAIVTGSEFTLTEMADLYGIPEEKVFVAHYAVDPVFSATPADGPPPRSRPYFLAVGNLQPRKNLLTLVRAFRKLTEESPAIAEDLVVVGQPWYQQGEVFEEASDLIAGGRVDFTGYVSDEELVSYIRGATALAYPSVYEGFGLPPLEAMAAGTPAIVADIPVMREVVADSALRVEPMSVEAWARGLRELSQDASMRSALASQGAERAATFSWDAMADRTLAAIDHAAESRR